jgi:hypothetical protein
MTSDRDRIGVSAARDFDCSLPVPEAAGRIGCSASSREGLLEPHRDELAGQRNRERLADTELQDS